MASKSLEALYDHVTTSQ